MRTTMQGWLAIYSLALCLLLDNGSVAFCQTVTDPESVTEEFLIPLYTPEGRMLLRESDAAEAYWRLSQYYAPQPDLSSCSVASCMMVLNALPLERPVSESHAPFRLFTCHNFFTKEVEAVVSRKTVSASGMSLEQLTRCLATYPVAATCVFASNSTVAKFREDLTEQLGDENRHIIVNYHRRALGQVSGGHISPLGAYNSAADVVLILDTANYKYPWVWVKTDRLWKAMVEIPDPASKKSRGYVVVSMPQG